MVLKNLSPVKARTYLTAAVKQCDELGFKDLAEELKLNFN